MSKHYQRIIQSQEYQNAKKHLLDVLKKELSQIQAVQPTDPSLKETYHELVQSVGTMRGRELFYKFIGSGAGNGPFAELADGSVKYDLITGIGVNFFGHANLDLFEAQMDGLWGDVMQGNLSPNQEYANLMRALLESVGSKSNLKHVWLSTCGATVNEIALKIIRQKKFPASKIFAFKDCFAGRTTALQEITDNAKYREGQPTYGEVFYLPFYKSNTGESVQDQVKRVISMMKEEMDRQPGRYAMLEFELVQGEGGFNFAPREFILPIIEHAKKSKLAIWVDEVQTFGRTGEIFCYQTVGIDEYVDVVTVAKLLQTGAVLFSTEYNPKPGLVSGTFAGSTSGLRAGIKALEILKTKLVGENGRIKHLEKITHEEFAKIKAGPVGKHLVDYTSVGAMIAFTIYDGSLDLLKKFLFKLWDQGAIAFYCGHGPYRARMLPPFGVITDNQWRDVFKKIETAMLDVGKENSL